MSKLKPTLEIRAPRHSNSYRIEIPTTLNKAKIILTIRVFPVVNCHYVFGIILILLLDEKNDFNAISY